MFSPSFTNSRFCSPLPLSLIAASKASFRLHQLLPPSFLSCASPAKPTIKEESKIWAHFREIILIFVDNASRFYHPVNPMWYSWLFVPASLLWSKNIKSTRRTTFSLCLPEFLMSWQINRRACKWNFLNHGDIQICHSLSGNQQVRTLKTQINKRLRIGNGKILECKS